jgi:peptide/nickel transport system permease protein
MTVTMLVVSMAVFAIMLLSPPEERAQLYMPANLRSGLSEEDVQRLINKAIREHGLDQSFPLQYIHWMGNLARGDWGYSPVEHAPVLQMLIARSPATAELALYSILLLVPLGALGGAVAAWNRGRAFDLAFRSTAFVATSVPPFVLGLLLLGAFYVGLRWFPPERLGVSTQLLVSSSSFRLYTGLYTIDGLLNGRPDITLEALRHLVLPVFTLSLVHWAVLGRITRTSVLEELGKPYITAARAHGLPARRILWRHAFRNALLPTLNASALSAAALVTGVYVVEVVFGMHGVSELMRSSMAFAAPDTPLAVGFAVYSVLLVLPLTFLLDLTQALLDPRLRQGVAGR